MPNAQSEPRAWLARFVLLGAQNVTAMLVGSTAWLGSVFIVFINLPYKPTIQEAQGNE